MYLTDLENYVANLGAYLTKCDISTDVDEAGHRIVVATKETYVYEDEDDADKKINEARQDLGFMEAKKKFKQGKINKNGEITKPDTYTVVIKLGH